MSRIALLIPILIFLTYDPAYARRPVSGWDTALFFSVFLALPLLGRLLAVRVSRLSSETRLLAASERLARMMGVGRVAVLLWTAAGLYVCGYGDIVSHLTSRMWGLSLVGAVAACTPAYLSWLLMFWAQYPAERLLREQAMLVHLEADFPVRATPSPREYVSHHFRTGPGIFVLPVLLVLFVRDMVHLGLVAMNIVPGAFVETLLYLVSAIVVFMVSPLLLIRVLRTRPLPPGELRDRLTRLARRSNVRFKEVLLWDTGHTACNALVTGLFPRFRYVLLSDLLLESLHDQHIEAVFAHELGHIVHRHVAWYVGFLFSTVLLLHWVDVGLGWAASTMVMYLSPDLVGGALAIGLTLGGFGLLSRSFERQADVFAARAMQSHPELSVATPPVPSAGASEHPGLPNGPVPESPLMDLRPLSTQVGARGASTFASALKRVAWVNNIPLEARNFTHGSIGSRIRAVVRLSETPVATSRFDAGMFRLRAGLTVLILAGLVTLLVS